MRAVSSRSTRKPIETTFRRPSPTCIWIGSILPASGEPPRRPSTPSIRGIEKPQMSASMTPTVKPRCAMAAARFTVTDDLPTPPFPDAIISTLVVAGISVSGVSRLTFQRAIAMVAAFSSGVSSVQVMWAFVTPGSPSMRALTSRWIWARNGQPDVVRAMVTSTRPLGPTTTAFAMPNSTMLEPSSGSTTPRRSSRTWSEDGSSERGRSLGRCSPARLSRIPRSYADTPFSLLGPVYSTGGHW